MSIKGLKKPIRATHGKTNNYPRVLDRMHDIVNGQVDTGSIQPSAPGLSPAFSPGTNIIQGNVNNTHVKVTFPAPGDSDVTITHNLNRLPAKYKLVSANNPVMIYNGSVAPTTTQLTLRGHLGGANPAIVVLEIE